MRDSQHETDCKLSPGTTRGLIQKHVESRTVHCSILPQSLKMRSNSINLPKDFHFMHISAAKHKYGPSHPV